MADIMIFAACAAVCGFFCRKELYFGKLSGAEAVLFFTLAFSIAVFFTGKYLVRPESVCAAGLWVLVVFAFNIFYGMMSARLLIIELLFVSALLSFFMLEPGDFLMLVFPASTVIVIYISRIMYKYIRKNSGNIMLPFLFLLWSAFSLHELIFRTVMNFYAEFLLILLVAVLFNLHKSTNLEDITGEEGFLSFAAALYPVFMIQCFIVVLIFKNPVLN